MAESLPFVSVKTAASRIGVSPTTVRRLCKSGALAFSVNPKNHYRQISKASLDRYVSEFVTSPLLAQCDLLTMSVLRALEAFASDPRAVSQMLDNAATLCSDAERYGCDPRRIKKIRDDIQALRSHFDAKAGD